jgi:Tfp pilus assembly protein PilF
MPSPVATSRSGRATARRTPTRSAPSSWIAGRVTDSAWIILCPVLALLVMQALWTWSGLSDLAIFSVLFGLIVTGHHMPGWIRAFGEPEVYRRNRGRLWVSLFAIPALVILPTAFGLGAVALTIAATFDLWHVAMQQHGFGRIYAAKAGDRSRRSSRLDLACALTWYATVVAWSDSWMQAIARAFRKAGLPVFDALTPRSWAAVRWTLLGASAALAIAYTINALRLWKVERISTPQKHLLHAVAFAVLLWSYQAPSWYRANSVQNLFHAMQYFFMVWIYGSLSLRRESTQPGSFYRALFGRRRGMILFSLLIALYGAGAIALSSSGYRLTGVEAERTAQIIGSIGIASLLLHFYVDSFIWKVRSKEVRRALAIREDGAVSFAPATPVEGAQWRGALHAIAYFGAPALLIALLGAKGRSGSPAGERTAIAHEATLFPRSAMARYANGVSAAAAGDLASARAELTAACDLAPSFAGPARTLAEIDHREGKRDQELAHASLAVRAEPRDAELRYLYGSALAREKRWDEAESQYREVVRLRPQFAGGHQGLGVIAKWRGNLAEAIPFFRRAASLDPNYRDAWCDLAGALATVGQTKEALDTLGNYRSRHPEDQVAANLEAAIRADAANPR